MSRSFYVDSLIINKTTGQDSSPAASPPAHLSAILTPHPALLARPHQTPHTSHHHHHHPVPAAGIACFTRHPADLLGALCCPLCIHTPGPSPHSLTAHGLTTAHVLTTHPPSPIIPGHRLTRTTSPPTLTSMYTSSAYSGHTNMAVKSHPTGHTRLPDPPRAMEATLPSPPQARKRNKCAASK